MFNFLRVFLSPGDDKLNKELGISPDLDKVWFTTKTYFLNGRQ